MAVWDTWKPDHPSCARCFSGGQPGGDRPARLPDRLLLRWLQLLRQQFAGGKLINVVRFYPSAYSDPLMRQLGGDHLVANSHQGQMEVRVGTHGQIRALSPGGYNHCEDRCERHGPRLGIVNALRHRDTRSGGHSIWVGQEPELFGPQGTLREPRACAVRRVSYQTNSKRAYMISIIQNCSDGFEDARSLAPSP